MENHPVEQVNHRSLYGPFVAVLNDRVPLLFDCQKKHPGGEADVAFFIIRFPNIPGGVALEIDNVFMFFSVIDICSSLRFSRPIIYNLILGVKFDHSEMRRFFFGQFLQTFFWVISIQKDLPFGYLT